MENKLAELLATEKAFALEEAGTIIDLFGKSFYQ
jgi:hypothetical protein